MTRTHNQHIVSNATSQFGYQHWITRFNSHKWQVEIPQAGVEMFVTTKRQALGAAEQQVRAFLNG